MSTKGDTSKTVNTKTPSSNKEKRCPMCFRAFELNETWTAHVLRCAKERTDELKFPCSIEGCNYITRREYDLKRHMETKHNLFKDSSDTGKDSSNLHDSLSSPSHCTSKRRAEDHLPVSHSQKKHRSSISSTSLSKTSGTDGKGVPTEEKKTKRKVHHSIKRVVSFIQDGKNVEETETRSWDSEED